MRMIKDIQRCLSNGQFEFSHHAFKRAVERNIENYPDDKYAPSCLLLGFTTAGRPLHIQVSHVESDLLKIITIYEPNPEEWYDYSRRR
jgi:hypothetical protein